MHLRQVRIEKSLHGVVICIRAPKVTLTFFAYNKSLAVRRKDISLVKIY